MITSFARAWDGFRHAVRYERNLRIQLCVAAYVILFGALAGLEPWAWAVCLACCGLVLCAETLNTALERLCDLVRRDYDEHIRLSKDTAAGGVLLASLFAATAGLVVFLRPEPLARLWEHAVWRPWLWILPAALLALSILFVGGVRKPPAKDKP